MLLVYCDPDGDHHDTPARHPEHRARVDAVLEGFARADLFDAVAYRPPRPATRDEISRVHALGYIDAIEKFCVEGGGPVDGDTWASRGSFSTALDAAGAGIAAVEALDAGEADSAFVVLRPPGHHATRDHGMGFCLLNNVAVAAAELTRRGERVAIVDWDVHHGNGTQDVFWDDPTVLYVSTHQSPLYPGTGGVAETGGPGAPGLTVNVPLPARATGDVVRRALDEVAAPVLDRFDPGWILVSAGFDAHRDDPLASLGLTSGDFADTARWVREAAPGGGRLILFLEGGYDLEALSKSAGAVASVLCEGAYRPEAATSGGAGQASVDEALRIRRDLDAASDH